MIEGFKIGFLPTRGYFNKSTAEICDHLKSLGYDAVEWLVGVVDPRTKKESDIAAVFGDTKNSGLEVSEIAIQCDLVIANEDDRRNNINYTIECIDALSSFGAKTFNLITGPIPWLKYPFRIGIDISMGEAWNMVFDAFDTILPAAKKHGVYIALESVWGMLAHDFYTAKFLIDHYQSPNFGLNFDPSHDIVSGNYDIGWIIRQWGNEKIKHVHLKDAAGVQDGERFVFPLLGEGKVNWKSFKEAMREIGYSGIMSVEFESFAYLANVLDGSIEEAAAISMDCIKKLFR